jgi:hypothetical protein
MACEAMFATQLHIGCKPPQICTLRLLKILDNIPKIHNQWLQWHKSIINNQIDYVGSTMDMEIDRIKAGIISSKQLSHHICDSSIIVSSIISVRPW